MSSQCTASSFRLHCVSIQKKMLRVLRLKLSPPLCYNNSNIANSLSKLFSSSAAAPTAADPSTIAAAAAFLEDSCGLSSDVALAVAKKRALKSTANARSFFALLESHGFRQAEIARVLVRCPRILSINAEKIAKPKLAFLQSAGLLELLPENPWILCHGLETILIPNFELLQSVLRSKDKVLTPLKRTPCLINGNPVKVTIPRMEALRSHGVTDPVMMLLLTKYGFLFLGRRFEEALATVKEIGINPASTMFAHALGVLIFTKKKMLEQKFENFRSFGWSLEQTLFAFARFPQCMFSSIERVKKNMMFFQEELKWGPEYVSKHPVLLSLSLENRIIPRFKLLRCLMSKDLVKGDFRSNCFLVSAETFQQRYIIKYHDKVPELVADSAYRMLAVRESKEDPLEATQLVRT